MTDLYGYSERPPATTGAVGTRPRGEPDLSRASVAALPPAVAELELEATDGPAPTGQNLVGYDASATKLSGSWDVPLAAAGLAVGEQISAALELQLVVGGSTAAAVIEFLDGAAASLSIVSGEQQNSTAAYKRCRVQNVLIPANTVTIRLRSLIIGAPVAYNARRAMLCRGITALPYEEPPLRTARETQDQLTDGATYARTRGTYLDSNRPALLYRTQGTDNVTADTLGEHLAADSDSVLRNGGGQEGALGAAAPGWTGGSADVTIANDFAKLGTRSLKHVYAGAPGNRYAYQEFAVEAGDVWEISGWIRCSGGSVGQAMLNLDPGTGAVSRTLETEAPYALGPDVGILMSALTEWTFVRSVVEIGTSGTIRLYLQVGYLEPGDGTAWFDGVKARRIIKGASRLYSALSSSGDLNNGIGQLDGTQAKRLAFGFQSGTCRRGDAIVFSPPFAATPDLQFSSGSGTRYVEGDSTKWSTPAAYAAAKHQIVDLSDGGTLTRFGFTCTAELRQKGGTSTGSADFPNPNSIGTAGATVDAAAIGASPSSSGHYTVRYTRSITVESVKPGNTRTATLVIGIFRLAGGVETELSRATSTCSDDGSNPGGGTTEPAVVSLDVVATMAPTDQIRIKIISFTSTGASGVSSCTVHGDNLTQDAVHGVTWSYGGTDITASMTPDASDSVRWRAYGVQ